MAIVKFWGPLRDLSAIQEKMNRLFDETFARTRNREEGLGKGMWTPAVDIFETEDAVVVKAELPGIAKEDVHVEIKDGLLTLKGERKFEKAVEEESYHRIERSYGGFLRAFSLPASVDPTRIAAKMNVGVLEVRLPKKEKVRAKQIKVTVT